MAGDYIKNTVGLSAVHLKAREQWLTRSGLIEEQSVLHTDEVEPLRRGGVAGGTAVAGGEDVCD